MRSLFELVLLGWLALAFSGCARSSLNVAAFRVAAGGPQAVEPSGSAADVTTIEDLINEDLDESSEMVEVADPFEPVNRVMHGLNDRLYNYLLEPVSTAYETVMPDTLERGVANAFTNLRYPKRLAGNLLQGKLDGAARETGKFVVNSTVGLLGFVKASDRFEGLSVPPEDLGQTLGRWRVGRGPYLVLPFLGPNTLRDTVGMVGDGFLDPVFYIDSVAWGFGARTFEHVNDSPTTLADYNALIEGAIDPYVAIRSAYVQARDEAVRR